MRKLEMIAWLGVCASFGACIDGALEGQPATRLGALPLGPADAPETRISEAPAPGVRYLRIERGATGADTYTVDAAFVAERAQAEHQAAQLAAAGYDARVELVAQRAADDPAEGPLGYLVRVGSFEAVEQANAARDALSAAGYTGPRVVYTGEDGAATSGPWVVHVLEIDPHRFAGQLRVVLGNDSVPDRETLTSIAQRYGALAGINGGYFVIDAKDGTPGDLAGISVLDGDQVSEAVDGRTALVLSDQQPATITRLRDEIVALASDGATRIVDGLNRVPGLIRACGGEGGDQPVETPKHDFTCTDDSELIAYRSIAGALAPAGDGREVVLDGEGRVVEVRASRGGAIPAEGQLLAGTGDAADWLEAHAQAGSVVRIESTIEAERRLPRRASIVNGGPRLLRDGENEIAAAAEGFVYPENAEFYYRFGARRNPRTLAGVRRDGTLLLVAVDGRAPGYSVGASFAESAELMRALGALDALNLDGGGSTSLTLGSELRTRPSDATGERPLGDAIVLVP